MARDDTAHSGPAANGTGAKGALNGGGSKVPPTVADEHVPQFRLPVDSEHKAKALNLLSVAAPHMRAFHLSWVRPRALCHLPGPLSSQSSQLPLGPGRLHIRAVLPLFLPRCVSCCGHAKLSRNPGCFSGLAHLRACWLVANEPS